MKLKWADEEINKIIRKNLLEAHQALLFEDLETAYRHLITAMRLEGISNQEMEEQIKILDRTPIKVR